MSEPELVFAETSPHGSVEALIEQDERVAYFYLRGIEQNSFEMKSCWVRNLVPAPAELDRQRMLEGRPPALPEEFCRPGTTMQRLDEKRLRLVWFEEGDGAALLEDDQLLAVIPAWSGQEGFCGYARDCGAASPFCWPLPVGETLQDRVRSADRFWKSWETEDSPWAVYEPRILEQYEEAFGSLQGYYSIDGGHWPPRTLARFHWENRIVLLTAGNSLLPQPGVEMAFENPKTFRRFEVGCCLDESASQALVESCGKYLGGQTALPWSQLTFLAHGHTISCEMFLKAESLPDFSSILLLAQDKVAGIQKQVAPAEIFGEPVSLLWSLPLFENERKYLQETMNFSLLDKILSGQGLPMIEPRSMVL
ncbi:MAG: suppressor of fused domain protein [Planctomycetota bacterium]|nr:suppressor of fused domain protein [Planctomycetota bacterium]